MSYFASDNDRVEKLFDALHKLAEFFTFLITIMLALAVGVSSVGLFFYLKSENAISLYSKAISSIPMLTVLGFFSFALVSVMVLYAIFPAMIALVNIGGGRGGVLGNSVVKTKLKVKLKTNIHSAGRGAASMSSRFWRLFIGDKKYLDKLFIRLFWIGFAFLIVCEPIIAAASEGFNVWYGCGELIISFPLILLVLFYFALSIFLLSRGKSKGVVIANNYYGILIVAMVLPIAFVAPNGMVNNVLVFGVGLSMFCSYVLKLRYSRLFLSMLQETLALYLPMFVIVFVLIKIESAFKPSSSNSEWFFVVVVLVSSFLIFWSNFFIQYVIAGGVVGFNKVRNIIFVVLGLGGILIIFSPVVVSNILAVTEMGGYTVEYRRGEKIRIVIKVDGVEYSVDKNGKYFEVKS